MDFRQIIVGSGKRMAGTGLTVETWGNISCRDPESGLVYLTPSAMHYDIIVPEDVVVCDLSGNVKEGRRKATIEKDLHLEIYKARPEVCAIIHTHPVWSMVYACQGRDIPLFTDEAAQALGDTVHCAPHAPAGSAELAHGCVKALGAKGNAVLLQSHGAVCVGKTMDEAFKTATVLEATANVYQLIEASGGKPLLLAPEEIEAMQEFMRTSYGQ